MEDFWINGFLSEPWKLIFILCLFTLLFHMFFIFLWPLSNATWKKVDYIWVGLAAVGVISLSIDLRHVVASKWENIEHGRASIFFDITKSMVTNPMSSYECRYGNDHSDKDSEDFEIEFIKACNWLIAVSVRMEGLDFSSIPELSAKDFPTVDFNGYGLNDRPEWFFQMLTNYGQDRDRYVRTVKMKSPSPWESNLNFFAPFVLCLGIALRLTKVTGELRNTK